MTPEQWRRLNQLFHAAREQPPERHAAFIETHCADDEVLRHELSALLNAAKQSVHQFSAPVWEDVAALLPATDDAQVAAMQLTVGQRLLDRFDILRHLGSGGMGEVWAAYDWRLRRDVALKLLPARFTADVERVWRFDLEARATSALNHPNILTVYDIGAHEGAPCIVMELLEGANLRALLPPQAAPLSIRTALDYARQIAAGLAAAHEKNIVHRDLKPENLFVVKGGNVKILDFGLAKLKLPKSAAEFGSGNSQTRPNHLTGAGALIGTSGYMSPEQVRGEDVDHRSDLFSFGLILYEMLTGQQAFPQKNRMDALAAILKDDPPKLDALTEFNSQISLALEKIVQHCLEKNPDLRFQSARDLSFALDALSLPSGPRPAVPAMEDVAVASPMGRAVAAPAVIERPGWKTLLKSARLAWIFAASAALATLAAIWLLSPTAKQVTYTYLPLPEHTVSFDISGAAFSPDGRRVVMVAVTEGVNRLWLYSFDRTVPELLPGTENAQCPFWSPNGKSIGFFAQSQLKRIEAAGGSLPVKLCDVPWARAARGAAQA